MHIFDRDTNLCETAPLVYTRAISENRLINKNPNGGYLIRPFLKPGVKEKLMLLDSCNKPANRFFRTNRHTTLFYTRNIRREHGL